MKTIAQILKSYTYEVNPTTGVVRASTRTPFGFSSAAAKCDKRDDFSAGTGMNLAGLRLAKREYARRMRATQARISELDWALQELEEERARLEKAIQHKIDYLIDVLEPQYEMLADKLDEYEEEV